MKTLLKVLSVLLAAAAAALCVTAALKANRAEEVAVTADYLAQTESAQTAAARTAVSLPGDADGDGRVTTADSLTILKHCVGILKIENPLYADVDGDGIITTNDALAVLKFAAGIIKEFPAVSDTGQKTGNMLNGGLAFYCSDSIYYTDLAEGIYRCDADLSGQTMIYSGKADSLCRAGGYIYFIDYLDGASVCRIDMNGKGHRRIADGPAANLTADGKRLYYVNVGDKSAIYSCDLSGNDSEKLTDDRCSMLNVADGCIYYVSHTESDDYGSIVKLETETAKRTDLGCAAGFIDVYDGIIYYLNHDNADRVYTMTTDGKDVKRFCNYKTLRLNVAEGTMYFIRRDDNFSIHRLNTDKTGLSRVNRAVSDYLCVAGDYIFYTDEDMKVCTVKR
ncbi:MAG: DUF5050 domain-containing protein [Clostridia bacterium]|nr:DUF5050 domain-containing protein [Clostridia bacterium]